MYCKHCKENVGSHKSHHCYGLHRYVAAHESDCFLTSLVVADLTDNAALGYLVGGSMEGAIIGEIIADSNIPDVSTPDTTSDFSSGGGDSAGSGSGGDW